MCIRSTTEQLCGTMVAMGCAVRRNEPMAQHTTMRIGGPADLLAEPKSAQEIAALYRICCEMGEKPFLLGRGSNLLVADEGIRGLVIKFGSNFASVERIGEGTDIYAQAGADLSRICSFACRHGLSGLEFAWGIPGSLGGAVCMNAGAYGGEMKDVLVSIDYLSASGEIRTIPVEEADLSYRHSRFSGSGEVILGARIHLNPGDPQEIRRIMDETMEKRRDKQPLEYPSAGSTFKRPVGNYAAALIDQCGLKGRRVGGAMVSEKHAGFLINYDRASCSDMLTLIDEVKRVVQEQTGYLLECEVKLVGNNGKE